MKKLIVLLLIIPSWAWAEIPDGYSTVFDMRSASGMANTTLTCTDSGDGCDECEDESQRWFTGTDLVTGSNWVTDLTLTGRSVPPGLNGFYDNADGCVSSISAECHDVSIVSGIPLVGGGTGSGIKMVYIANCEGGVDYSRFDYRVYDATPVQNDNWQDLSSIYIEFDMVIADVTAWAANSAFSLFEIAPDSASFKISFGLVRANASPACPDAPCFGAKRNTVSFYQHGSPLYPESNKPFTIRMWYKADDTSGVWRGTYTCADCTTPVSETTIWDSDGNPTIDTGTPLAIKWHMAPQAGTAPATVYITRWVIAKESGIFIKGASGVFKTP